MPEDIIPAKDLTQDQVPITQIEQSVSDTPKFEDIPYYPILKVDKIYGGFPIFTSTPTHSARQGETVLVDDGSSVRKICSYLNGTWRCRLYQDEPTPVMTLLKANSGSTTSAVAVNLDTVSLSGLTALDTLLIYFTFSSELDGSSSLGVGGIEFYNNTDGATLIASAQGNGINASSSNGGQVSFQQEGVANTQIYSECIDGNASALQTGVNSASLSRVTSKTVTTAWTSAWTLALRQVGAVAGGGAIYWKWKVYKIAGQ